MKTQRVLIGAMLVLLAAVVTEAILLSHQAQRVGELEGKVSRNEQRVEAAAPEKMEQVEALLESVETQVQFQQEDLKKLTEQTRRNTEQLARVQQEYDERIRSLSVSLGEAERAVTSGAAQAENLARIVEEKVQEELEARRGEFGGEWKPTMSELSEALELDPRQEDQVAAILDRAKDEVFELATIPRADGTGKIDDFAMAMQAEDPERAMREVFQSLFTEKVPGRETTYLAEILQVNQEVMQQFEPVMNEEQLKQLQRLHVDLLGVQTGYDPFQDYLLNNYGR